MDRASRGAARDRMIEFTARIASRAFTLDAAFVAEARVAALFGPSGAGKSTIIDLIAGLVHPDSGRIAIGDEVMVDTKRGIFVPPHRRRIAVVFQDSLLFPHMTVRQNLAFGRFFTPRALRRIEQGPVVETLGIGHLLDRWPRTLSGGERQRVSLARALVASPRLLLMDEPLAALDMPRRFEIMRLIERVRDAIRIPILYVSHSIEEIGQIADEVVVIEEGRVIAQGPPAMAFAAARHLVERRRFGLSSPIHCRVERYEPNYDLSRLSHPAGTVTIAGDAGASGREVRVLVRATDVALSLHRPEGLSIRTNLDGVVEAIDSDAGPAAFVTIRLEGGDSIVAAVTKLARDELGLRKGQRIVCLVKSVALDERPVVAGAS
jgi:molybdate transport system ATP-binding protein